MTLTEAAEKTKKFLLYGGIFVGIILVGWMGFSWYYNNIYLPRRPIIQEPPNKEFGLLPKPHFPKSLTNSGEYSYSLDTPTGGLPQIPTELPRLIKVYFIPQLGATFLAPDRAKLLAKKFGFPNGPEIINPIKYRFTDELGGELLFDLENANFDFTRPIATNSPSFRDKQADDIGTKESLSKEFRSFLSNKGVLKDQLQEGKIEIFYNANSQKDSTEAMGTLWQIPITEGDPEKEKNAKVFPIVTPEFQNGLIKGTMTKYNYENNKFPKLSYTYWQIDITKFATYLTKKADDAFEELKKGEGIIVVKPSESNVSINKVYLGYYLAGQYTQYLQPVFVFEGQNFAAYVPAIRKDDYKKE